MVWLPNDKIFIIWNTGPASDLDIYGRMFDINGNNLTGDMLIHPDITADMQ